MIRASAAPRHLVLLGHPVSHSFSPHFQNAALVHLGLAPRYEPVDVTSVELATVVNSFAASRTGGNVTIPHKEAVAQMASCSPVAERVGAVNTFWFDDGALMGHNTDVEGVIAAIAEVHDTKLATAQCAVLGAGGSAAAILVALEKLGCGRIHVSARTASRAQQLATRVHIPVTIADTPDDAVRHADIVFNATPVGLRDNSMPVAPDMLARNATVIDLVCRPTGTAFVRACRGAGLSAIDGTTMLLAQGAASFECWFGVPAPVAVMRAALLTRFQQLALGRT